MTLLIDTATVPAEERLDYWSESSFDTYLPVHVQSSARDRFGARMWGYEVGPLSFFRISATPNTMVRTSKAIAACDPECLHVSVVLRGQISAVQEGRTGIARVGDLISYETSHPVTFRADQAYESLVVRVPWELLGPHAAQIRALTAVGIPGGEGFPRAAVAFLRALTDSLEQGTLEADDAQNTVDCVLDLVRGVYSNSNPTSGVLRAHPPPLPRGDPAQRAVVHRDEPRRSRSRPRGDRPRQLHLDPVSAQAVRGRGDDGVPVDPRRTSRAVPPRPARPGARSSDDPRDRYPLGPARPAALQPAVPRRVRLLAQRASPRRADSPPR